MREARTSIQIAISFRSATISSNFQVCLGATVQCSRRSTASALGFDALAMNGTYVGVVRSRGTMLPCSSRGTRSMYDCGKPSHSLSANVTRSGSRGCILAERLRQLRDAARRSLLKNRASRRQRHTACLERFEQILLQAASARSYAARPGARARIVARSERGRVHETDSSIRARSPSSRTPLRD